MASMPVKCVQISFLVFSLAVLSLAQHGRTKDDTNVGKRYRSQEPLFRPPPPPLPIKRRLQVNSGVEQPPSFFKSSPSEKAEARQFLIEPLPFDQSFQQSPHFQEQPQPQFSDQNGFQPRQQNSFDQNQFQQFNQPPQQQQHQQSQNFQFNQNQPQDQPAQQQQSFQDSNNFQSRQQENLPTLPPVFIPPNQPVGPPPALQSPIRNLFRQPEPPFSLAGLLQRFFNLFNLGNN